MQLVNEFFVDAPLDTAWAVLTDIPRIAECIPGGQLESSNGDEHHARIAVKVGPVGLTLTGTATIVSRDDAGHRMVVRGQARDHKGNGSAAATVVMAARENAGRSAVVVTTDLELGGRIAQFGSGVISQVSNRILGQFADRLNGLISAQNEPGATPASTAPSTAMGPTRRADLDERVVLVLTALAGVALGLALGRTAERLA